MNAVPMIVGGGDLQLAKKSPRFQMPDGNQVEFEFEAVEATGQNERNMAQGKATNLFDQVLVARIFSPGVSRRQVPVLEIERHFHDGKVRQSRFQYPRFAQYLEAWRKGEGAEGLLGTPLEACGLFNAALIAQYKVQGVHSVEQLAKVADSALGALGPTAVESRLRAVQYLAAKGGGEAIHELDQRLRAVEGTQARMRELEERAAADRDRIQQLVAENARLTKAAAAGAAGGEAGDKGGDKAGKAK